ncbi:MAG: BatD family protein, partial [Verrucomicrobiota bacterium]
IFNNFPLPQGMFADNREVTLKTKPVQIEVQPLPKDGRPEDFSGAVGKFSMEATVSPKKVSAGEPVNLKVAVSGQGNFEGMGAPALTGDEGWRSYPPSDKFQSTDSIGFTGEKTFEFALIARQDQTRTPGARFSYFDPSTGKYNVHAGATRRRRENRRCAAACCHRHTPGRPGRFANSGGPRFHA